MPTSIYLSGGRPGERAAAAQWLARHHFARADAPAAADLRRAVAAADAVVLLPGGRDHRRRDLEAGLAVGLARPVYCVGEPPAALAAEPAVRRFADWPAARAAVAELRVDARTPRTAELVLPEPAARFLGRFAAKTFAMAGHLDAHTPGVAAGVAAIQRGRQDIWRAVRAAWQRAGRPGDVADPAGGPLSPEAAAFGEDVAVGAWYERVLRLGEIAAEEVALARERDQIMAPRPAAD